MRMFDSVMNHIIIGFLSGIVGAVNIFLIYAIWRHSPQTMGKFRYYMINMAFNDFLFASAIAWLFLPNLLFPLPGALVAGLLRFFGRIGANIAFIVTIITGGLSMIAVKDCCLYRVFLFFQMHAWIDRVNGWYAVRITIATYLGIIVAVSGMGYFAAPTREEMAAYAKRHNITKILDEIPPDAPLVAFDLDNASTRFGAIVIGIFLVVTAAAHVFANMTVHRKLQASKSSMSKQTYQMQQSLTYILMIQAVIPALSISIPVIVYQIALFFYLDQLFESPVVEWFVVLIVGGYPLFNSSFTLYFLKPYRRFTASFFKRIICCMSWEEATAVLVEPTGSSSNSTSRRK